MTENTIDLEFDFIFIFIPRPDSPLCTVTTQEDNRSSTRKQDYLFMIRRLIMISESKSRVERIAKAKGVSMAQVSLAWLLSREGNFLFFFFPMVIFLG